MVDMNGRMYQPSGSYFYPPDPHIPDPENTLDYDRYTYVDDNPLTFWDPTGFCGVTQNDAVQFRLTSAHRPNSRYTVSLEEGGG